MIVTPRESSHACTDAHRCGSSRSHRATASDSIVIELRSRHRALTTSFLRSVGLASRSRSNVSVALSIWRELSLILVSMTSRLRIDYSSEV